MLTRVSSSKVIGKGKLALGVTQIAQRIEVASPNMVLDRICQIYLCQPDLWLEAEQHPVQVIYD